VPVRTGPGRAVETDVTVWAPTEPVDDTSSRRARPPNVVAAMTLAC